MFEEIFPITIIILVLIILMAVLAVFVYKKRKDGDMKDPDYRVFFILGITMFPLGLVFMINDNSVGTVFFIIGLVYLMIGLVNKDKWSKT
jgi:cell division protein FtsW (lipid II flippase)